MFAATNDRALNIARGSSGSDVVRCRTMNSASDAAAIASQSAISQSRSSIRASPRVSAARLKGDERAADVVHPCGVARALWQENQRQGDDDGAQRNVQPEYPLPRQVLGDDAAPQRANDAACLCGCADESERGASLLRREQVAHDCDCDGHERARAERLEDAQTYKPVDVGCEGDAHRAEHEEQQRTDEGIAVAPDVGQPADEGHRGDIAEQVAGDDPGCVV